MSTISVIMSVYNSEKPAFFDISLRSIWTDQILKPDEIILVEDGPLSEELLNVIEKWKENLGNTLKIIINKENLGLTKSLNKGIQIANGEYVARMDSDDISAPHRFKIQKGYLDSHPDVAVIGGSIMEFDSEHINLGIRKFPLDNNAVLKYIHKASPLAHPTVMMRKSIFDNGLIYNENYRTSQDIALWFDVLKAGYKIGNLKDITLKFRRDGNMFKRRSKAKALNEFKIYLKGIYNLNGALSWKYLFPIARFCFRMMPVSIVKLIYGTTVRTRILQ